MRWDLRSRYRYQLEKPHDFANRSGRPVALTDCIAVADELWPIEGHSLDSMDLIQFRHSLAVEHRVAAAIVRREAIVDFGFPVRSSAV